MNRPLIGITINCDYSQTHFWLPTAYCRRIQEAGGLPLLLPPAEDSAACEILSRLQGLLLSGGGDLAPLFLGEEPLPGLREVDPDRDRWELALTRAALQLDLPLFGICRGMQVLNTAAGGSIIQHLSGTDLLQHSQQSPRSYPSHTVRVQPETALSSITEEEVLPVNSFHHQGIKDAAPNFIVAASSSDGVIEAIELPTHPFCLGVQWHPEALDHPASYALFTAFINAAQIPEFWSQEPEFGR